jgi:hypothetical protein
VLDGRPLVAAHRAGSRVGQQVDQDVVGMEREQVSTSDLDRIDALVAPGTDVDPANEVSLDVALVSSQRRRPPTR